MDADALAPGQIGRTIAEKYRLLGLLGSGGMGVVYLAEHVFTQRQVALKCMRPECAHSQRALERFVRESRAPSAIGHPGIVQVLDGGEDADGSLYLVLELLDGVSLRDALKLNALDLRAVLQIGIELLEALAAAHAKGFVHRDIKPDNVFLANDGRGGVTVKLLDFGIAALRDGDGSSGLTRTGAVLGTPTYMSPEQAKGERVDARSDLWAVGALLYRVLAGRAPYVGDTDIALIVSIVNKQHAPLSEARPDLPEALLHAVERALRKAPEDRFQTAEQMCDAIKAAARLHASSSAGASHGSWAAAPLPPRAAGALVRDPPPAAAGPGVRPAGQEAGELRAGRSAQPGESARRAESIAVARRAQVTSHRAQPDDAVLSAWIASRSAGWRLGEALGVVAVLCLFAAGSALIWRARGLDSPAALSLSKAARGSSDSETQRAPETALDPPAPVPEPRPEDAERDQAAAEQGLRAEDLTRVLMQHQAELERCLQESVVAQMLAGVDEVAPFRLDISLQVSASGRVANVDIAGRAPDDLSACLRARLLAVAFPHAAAPTLFQYPLVLAPHILGT